MKVILKKAVVVVTIGMMAMLQSCSSNDDLDDYTPTNFNVGGKVEKGPFVRGTAIQMQPLDADLDETGESFTSTITDNEGTFTFGSKLLKSPYIKLSASGYYFNEVTGELSKGTLALNAVANLQNAADVNLNILSHLKYQRVMDLVAKDGKSFKEANNQAQEEVLKTFGLEKYAKTDVNHFSITSGTDEAAALIAVSSLILYNRSEAQITEYLSQLSEEFAEDGNFSETTKLQIRKDMFSLESKLPQIAENIKKRYQEMGKEVAVKNLIYYFDWDGDGTAGNEIAPENHPVSLETNNINVPMEGGSYEVKANTTVPVYLERPSIPGDDIYDNSTSVSGMEIYETGSGSEPCINYTKELNNNILKVVVKAASFRKEQAVSIPLYDGMGNEVARLNLTQQANPNAEIIVPRLGSVGISCVSEFMKSLANAVTLEAQMNFRYTKIINDPNFVAPIRSSEPNIRKCWNDSYQALNMIARLYRADTMYRAVYSPYLNGTVEDLYDGLLMKDMDRAVDILKEKIEEGKKIRVIGDYDIDGVNATYILQQGLAGLGADVDTDIPDRIKDGYGLNQMLIDRALEDDVDTIITCDNGIAAMSEIAYGKENGMTIVVTDHHEVPYLEENGEKKYLLPPADAVVDPHRADCEYPFKGLCGAAVAA